MSLLTTKGKLILDYTVFGTVMVVLTSSITAFYIKIQYINKNKIDEYMQYKINEYIKKNDIKIKTNEEPIIKSIIQTVNENIQPNLQVMVESVKRPVKAIEPLSINSPIHNVTEQLKNAIYSYESDFNTTAFSPSGNHSGLCQMSDKALKDVRYKGNHYKFAKEPYYVQDEYCTKRFNYIIKVLENNNIVPTIYKVYTTHQLGYTGGINLLIKNKINKTHIVSNINNTNLIDAWEIQTKQKLEKGFNIK